MAKDTKKNKISREALTLRSYLPGDEAAMAELVAYTLRVSNQSDYAPAYLKKIAESHSAAYFAERAKDSHFYVICHGSKIVGCGGVTGYRGSTDESYLISVFVHPDYQKKGLGRMILEALEADENFTRAKRTELASSITAAGFYRKLGYHYKNGTAEPDGAGVIPMEKYNTDKEGSCKRTGTKEP